MIPEKSQFPNAVSLLMGAGTWPQGGRFPKVLLGHVGGMGIGKQAVVGCLSLVFFWGTPLDNKQLEERRDRRRL